MIGLVLFAVHAGEATGQRVRRTSTSGDSASTYQLPELHLGSLDLHPDILFQPYTAGKIEGDPKSPQVRMIMAFRDLLNLYQQRQGEDDNFTIRVIDNRSGDLLELFVLEADRAKYERSGNVDWKTVDEKRRVEMKRLIDKYANRGIPRSAISVRWGHANEVLEARENEIYVIDYEIRLARYLGLSLLSTEIGTVETFNQDRLVSRAGARGRYQMMPYLLRKNGIKSYALNTAAGNQIEVREEWHPLLTMEPAFLTLRGYINASGHEIPGISAYHAGPGNIYRIYRLFLEQGNKIVKPSSTVMDAYLWGISEGFDTVSQGSSFGQYSRSYVASAYGSLRAMENAPIYTSQTLTAERVQLRPGKQVYLRQILGTLETHEDEIIWGDGVTGETTYARFRSLNPHFALPAPTGRGIPDRGDVRLVATVKGTPVRFFLPLGTSLVLEEAGLDVLDPEETFYFDENTYHPVYEEEITEWDRAYEEVVRDVERFGFTLSNRKRVSELKEKFEVLAQRNPSHYRLSQLNIIETHDRLWNSEVWETLAQQVGRSRRKLGLSNE